MKPFQGLLENWYVSITNGRARIVGTCYKVGVKPREIITSPVAHGQMQKGSIIFTRNSRYVLGDAAVTA